MVQITSKRLSKVINYTSVCHSNPRMYRNNTMGHCIHQMGFYSSWTGRPETCRCGFVGRYPPSNCRDSLIWSHWFFHSNPLRLLFSCSFWKNHLKKKWKWKKSFRVNYQKYINRSTESDRFIDKINKCKDGSILISPAGNT